MGENMTGYQNKKMSAEIRWLGPYPPNTRHADSDTLDHIIDLRKRLAEAERQRDNALDKVVSMQKKITEMKTLLGLK
jgi:hypothetical protein